MKFLSLIWKKWLVIGKKIGTFQSQVLFGIFYLVIMSAVGLAARLFFDPLGLENKSKKSNFTAWPHRREDISSARMQY